MTLILGLDLQHLYSGASETEVLSFCTACRNASFLLNLSDEVHCIVCLAIERYVHVALRPIYLFVYLFIYSIISFIRDCMCVHTCVCVSVSMITYKISNVLIRKFVVPMDITQGQID